MQDVLRYGGLAIFLIWFSEVGLVLGMSLILFDAAHPGSTATEWLIGLGQDLISFGALTALGVTLTAIHLCVSAPNGEFDSRRSPLLRDQACTIASLLAVGMTAVACLERLGLHLPVATTVVVAYTILCAITLVLATRAMVSALRTLPDRIARPSGVLFAIGVLTFAVAREFVDLQPVVIRGTARRGARLPRLPAASPRF